MKLKRIVYSIFTLILLVSTSAFAQEEAGSEIETAAIGKTLVDDVDTGKEKLKKCKKGKKCKKEAKCKKGKSKKACKEGCTKACCAKTDTTEAKSCKPGCEKACCVKPLENAVLPE